jgi:hypothetical protein
MALSKTVAFRGVQDCKIEALSTDSTSSLTYAGTLYDIPIKDFKYKPNFENYELKHDDTVQEYDSQIQSYTLSGTMGRIPMNALAIFLGGDVADSGSPTTQKETFTHETGDLPKYFRLEIMSNRVMETDKADTHIQFFKCKMEDIDFELGEDFATVKFTAKAIRTINNAKIKTQISNETAAEIATYS